MIVCSTPYLRAGRALLLAAVLLIPACAGADDAEDGTVRPADAPSERRFIAVEWQEGLRIGGAEDDSTLNSPFRLAASPMGVHLLDYHPKRVLLYGHDGRRLWAFGREGAGPDEFRDPRDLKVDTDGRTWVLDPANARVTVLDSNGSVLRRLPLGNLQNSPRELLTAGGTGALLMADARGENPLVRIDSAGRVVERDPFPWSGFAGLEYLATQVIAASSPWTGDWVMAFRMGDGFFTSRGGTVGPRHWFVEHVPFPEVVVTRNGGTTTWRHRERPVDAAISVTLSRERVYVLFGGTTGDRVKMVDSYSLRDGSYQGTYRLPRGFTEIAWYDGGLYTLAERPYPELAYWKPAGEGLP